MARLGLWGGSFNPPTYAHMAMAQHAIKQLKLDNLLWIVAPHNPFKESQSLAPFQDRLAMVRLILVGVEKMQASDIEDQLGSSLTINTLRHFTKTHPDDTVFFLMGMDNWQSLHLWGDDYSMLFDHASLVVFNRPGYETIETALATKEFAHRFMPEPSAMQLRGNWSLLDNEPIDMAATQVRMAIKRGETPRQIEPVVLEYIRKHGLYS